MLKIFSGAKMGVLDVWGSGASGSAANRIFFPESENSENFRFFEVYTGFVAPVAAELCWLKD